MKYCIKDQKFLTALAKLRGSYGFSLAENGVMVNFVLGDQIKLRYADNTLTIYYQKLNQAFWALKQFSDTFEKTKLPKKSWEKVFTPRFNDLTYMLDCSRNAVYKLDTIKKVVSQLVIAGYDTFMLYTEDTFKVEKYPYFGYLRTPYTKDDIKAIDEYCKVFGIELVPCIQTLGHFNQIVRYPSMANLFDINEILLVGENTTYDFVEELIKTCAEYFTSRRINIGMDEAYLLGRGKYLDLHGYKKRFEIMAEHLKIVNELCQKYGFKPMMWSDMFFSLTLNDQYGSDLDDCIAKLVPEGIELIYWDYCSTSTEHYSQMMQKHAVFNNKIGFAGGAWKWLGFTPDNRYSFKAIQTSMLACEQNQIDHYIVTGWGDNGAEASCFATMPSVYYAGYAKYNDYKMDENFERAFKSFSGLNLADFLAIDLANRITENNDIDERNTANKYLLFNDILLGTLDTIIAKGQNDLYKAHAQKLAKVCKRAGEWSYIFETQRDLCEVLSIKAELGINLREAYQNGHKERLKKLLSQMKDLQKLVENLHKTFAIQWEKEARPNGFDVQDIRFGALKERLSTAIKKVELYLKQKTFKIDELEENLLCFMGNGLDFEKDFDQCEYRWQRMTTVNLNN